MKRPRTHVNVTINVEIEPSETFEAAFKALAESFGYEKTKPAKFETDRSKERDDMVYLGKTEEPKES